MSRGGAPAEQNKAMEEMLRRAKIVQQQAPTTQRRHQVIFMGITFGLMVRINEEHIVEGYQIQIDDPADNTSYIFPFDQEMLTFISERSMSLPNIGEKFEENVTPE